MLFSFLSFFFRNTTYFKKPQAISGRGGGRGPHPLHSSPRSAPDLCFVFLIMEDQVKWLRSFGFKAGFVGESEEKDQQKLEWKVNRDFINSSPESFVGDGRTSHVFKGLLPFRYSCCCLWWGADSSSLMIAKLVFGQIYKRVSVSRNKIHRGCGHIMLMLI